MSKIIEYLKETKTELKHVIWPSRSQTLFYTLIVVVLSILIAYFLVIAKMIHPPLKPQKGDSGLPKAKNRLVPPYGRLPVEEKGKTQ